MKNNTRKPGSTRKPDPRRTDARTPPPRKPTAARAVAKPVAKAVAKATVRPARPSNTSKAAQARPAAVKPAPKPVPREAAKGRAPARPASTRAATTRPAAKAAPAKATSVKATPTKATSARATSAKAPKAAAARTQPVAKPVVKAAAKPPARPVAPAPAPVAPMHVAPARATPAPAALQVSAASLPLPAAFPPAPEPRPAIAREISPAFASLVPAPALASVAAPVSIPARAAAPAHRPAPPIGRGTMPMPGRPGAPVVRGPQPTGRPLPVAVVPPPAMKAEPIEFVEGDHVVYPTHGVGKVMGIVNEEIAGHRLQLIVVTFDENRMTLRVPTAKARSSGLRKLASRKMIDTALATLKGRARIKRTMWSRRAQEYEAKINSGDPVAIAEVVRDLHRNAGQPDQSFSERQIYEAALDRLASELAAIDGTDKPAASEKLAGVLKTA
jgi:CarD family transcriptional regulator